jgi:hypothetical protein
LLHLLEKRWLGQKKFFGGTAKTAILGDRSLKLSKILHLEEFEGKESRREY